jgi:hypothetical protein
MDMSRRAMLTDVLAGAAVAAVGITTIGWAVAPNAAEAAPTGIPKPVGAESDELIERVQVVVVGPRRRRHRGRRVCWWHRGRRVCGWR